MCVAVAELWGRWGWCTLLCSLYEDAEMQVCLDRGVSGHCGPSTLSCSCLEWTFKQKQLPKVRIAQR